MKTLLYIAMSLFFIIGAVLFFMTGNQRSEAVQKGVKTATGKEEMNLQTATFAGGCFWCTESDFEKLPGVVKVISGYTGGTKENPTYAEVSSGKTGHVEA
ncbi:MAG: peptide-methionine (S)-S-oxide reductase, partial [Thermodesulfobacteriota bacterium]